MRIAGLSGFDIAWQNLYNNVPRKISLPTYPFDKREYWIDHNIDNNKNTIDREENISKWFYRSFWIEALPVIVKDFNKYIWLIFSDNEGCAEIISSLLDKKNHTYVIVAEGEKYQKLNNNHYQINPLSKNDYISLLVDCRNSNFFIDSILHLASFCKRRKNVNDSDLHCFHALLNLTQALIEIKTDSLKRFFMASNDILKTCNADGICPEKSTIVSFARVIPQELTHLKSRCIDISIDDFQSNPEVTAYNLFQELFSKDNEGILALRGNSRLIETFAPIESDYKVKHADVFTSNGVYILIGGLGNIGKHYAQFLSANVQSPTIIFIGRKNLPAQDVWDNFDKADKYYEQVQFMLSIKKEKAFVEYYPADLTDFGCMNSTFKSILNKYKRIDGVIHAAGVPGELHCMKLSDIGSEYLQNIFSAKQQGLYNIYNLSKEYSFNNCWIVSSISSILGGISLCAYSATHIFIDNFVKRISGENTQWSVLNWDALDLNSEEKESNVKVDGFGSALDELTIKDNECKKLLERGFSLPASLTQCIVSTAELNNRYKIWVKKEFNRLASRKKKEFRSNIDDRPNISTTYIAPKSSVEKEILECWQQVLGVGKIGINDNFFELGGHSLSALELVDLINDKFRKSLSIVDIFGYPTISALSLYLGQESNKKEFLERVDFRGKRARQFYKKRKGVDKK